MTTVFQSEPWTRPSVPPFPIGPLRVKPPVMTKAELMRHANCRSVLMPLSAMPVLDLRPPNVKARVVLWGGRKDSVQFGSRDDRFLASWRTRRANTERLLRLTEAALLKRELLGHRTHAMEGLIDMGRMLEEMTW